MRVLSARPRALGAQSRWREFPNMISSQDGTEDRLPRAVLRPDRADCSPAAGADGASAAGFAGASGSATGGADTVTAFAARGGAGGAGASWCGWTTRGSWAGGRACRAGCEEGGACAGRPGGPVGTARETCAATVAGLAGEHSAPEGRPRPGLPPRAAQARARSPRARSPTARLPTARLPTARPSADPRLAAPPPEALRA